MICSEIKLCECGCGKPAPIATSNIPSRGRVRGQQQRFITGHNRRKCPYGREREYSSFFSAQKRCTNPQDCHWKYYGGRGIRFLFTSFEQFFAELGPRPAGTSIDRYPNNDGNYEPGNVRWATAKEQANNQRHGNQWGAA